jgi:haloalkane dehalogenase
MSISLPVTITKATAGAMGQPHITIKGAGHFVQEDKGEEFAGIVNAFIVQTRK